VNRNRSVLLIGIWSLALLSAACAGSPTTTSSVGESLAPVTDDPLTQLCDASDRTSLAAIATALERPDDDTADMTQLSASLAVAKANLVAIDVEASVQPAVDRAASATDALQEVIEDPDSRGDARTQAAEAFRALDAEICP
jgi:hypothetical protein